MVQVPSRLRTGFKEFCEYTSMHGFAELYHAKSHIWITIWISILLASVAVTTYQTCTTTAQYLTPSTSTVMGPVEENDIYYPPLRLCYWQWYFWIDWPKALSLNYSKYMILYSVSYFNTIYSSEIYDLGLARKEFINVMKENNFTHLSQFYISIARKIPILAPNNIDKYFDRNIFVYKDPYLLFCYEISEKNMVQYFSTTKKQKIIQFSTLDESYSDVNDRVTFQEYNSYSYRWADKTTMYHFNDNNTVDLSKFAQPITLFLGKNIAKGTDIVTENDAYNIDLEMSVFTWMNKPDKRCRKNETELSGVDNTCEELCHANYLRATCTCIHLDDAVLLGLDYENVTCSKEIFFINVKQDSVLTSETVKYREKVPYVCNDSSYSDGLQKCLDSCVPACQIWKMDKTISIERSSSIIRMYGAKNMTKIIIQYPLGSDIIMMTEEDTNTWESFIGNVGGLLGIWTGASVLTFLQMIYHCCFSSTKYG